MTHVNGETEVEETLVKKRKQYLPFLAREWWEVAQTDHLANIIHVTTDHAIDRVYVNGELWEKKTINL